MYYSIFEFCEVYRSQEEIIDTVREAGVKEGLVQGLEKGLEKGLEQGKKARNIEIAKNLLDVLDIETIALKTGLTKNEIQELKCNK